MQTAKSCLPANIQNGCLHIPMHIYIHICCTCINIIYINVYTYISREREREICILQIVFAVQEMHSNKNVWKLDKNRFGKLFKCVFWWAAAFGCGLQFNGN